MNNGINGPRTHAYQNCSTSQILIFGGYVQVRDCIPRVHTILNHIDTMAILPRYGGFHMVYTQMISEKKYRQKPIPYGSRKCEIRIKIPCWYQQKVIPAQR